jgi:glyoxylase-like metal-dependent hydrolase (beta-lactamase superfamily II)
MQKPEVRGFYDVATATWSYVVWSAESADKKCAIIDSVLGFDIASARTDTIEADKIIAFVQQQGLQVQWILETHIHADHLTAAHYLKQKLGGKTAISQHICAVLATWEPILQNGGDTPQDGSQFDVLFAPNECFMIGALPAQMLATPGHTPADSSYYIGDAVFVGDTVFLPDNGSGRCDFPGGDAGQSYDSIQKIFALPDATRVYVGHDYPEGRSPHCMATVAACAYGHRSCQFRGQASAG